MRKPKKLILAEWLDSKPKLLSAAMMMQFVNSKDLGVQVKTIDSDGNFVIKFSSSDPWIEPYEWLHNYKVTAKARYEEAASVYHSLYPPVDSGSQAVGSLRVAEANPAQSNVRAESKDVFPADTKQFTKAVAEVMKRYPGLTTIDPVLIMAAGLMVLTDVQVDPRAKQFIGSQLIKRQQEAKSSS